MKFQLKKQRLYWTPDSSNDDQVGAKLTESVSDDTSPFDSNYQVSLIDESVLRVRTTTNQSVSIDCNVIVKEEIQSNKIFIHPKAEETKQEVEVLVKIGNDEIIDTHTTDDDNTETIEKKKESNYQVTLISENVLRIKISTNKSVSVDCSLLDKTTKEDGEETQSNKIFIHPKQGIGKQDVEIFVKIGEDALKSDASGLKSGLNKSLDNPPLKLTPNPIVADILSRINISKTEVEEVEPAGLTDEERLDLKIGRKNPWRRNKEFLRSNLYKGAVAANIIAIIAMIAFYSAASKKPKDEDIIEQRRLIVMQDLPENLNMQNQNVDDPNKPPDPPKDDGTTGTDIVPPVITPKKIRPPKVNLPKLNNENLSENDSTLNKELDSLRKKNNITGNQNGKTDTGAVNTSLMPDSLLKNLSENEVGLAGRFPPNWKQIDARTINMKDDFKGILLVDTTAKSKEEALNMFIELDAKGEKMTQFQFKRVFDEDSLRTVYALDPKQEGKLTYYRFYVATKTDNVFVNTFVVQSVFEKYKAEIERVVKTIQIRKPENK